MRDQVDKDVVHILIFARFHLIIIKNRTPHQRIEPSDKIWPRQKEYLDLSKKFKETKNGLYLDKFY